MSDAADQPITVAFKRLPHGDGLPTPAYESAEAAGMDIPAAVDGDITLAPGERRLVPSGFAIALPTGYEAQIRPRSGLALKHGISIVNAPGTIDADYRGEIGVVLINLGDQPFAISRGQRIAQLIVAPVTRVHMEAVEILPETKRGSGGFGSTGSQT
jgi:dUTP pyrophosphatase